MKLFICEPCNFSSKLKTDLNRHLNTKKHFTNTECSLSAMVKSQKEPQKSQKEPQKSQKEPPFLCDYCNSKFITYANKRRHEIHRCKENPSTMKYKIHKLEKVRKENRKNDG